MTQRDSKGRFIKGHSGHKKGRPVGAKTRPELTKRFISDVADVWESRGRPALIRMAEENPVAFGRLVATVIPSARDDTLTVEHKGRVEQVSVNFVDTPAIQAEDKAEKVH